MWKVRWAESVGQRVRVVVFGKVVKVYPTLPYMKVKGDDVRNYYTHPRYVRPLERWESGAP